MFAVFFAGNGSKHSLAEVAQLFIDIYTTARRCGDYALSALLKGCSGSIREKKASTIRPSSMILIPMELMRLIERFVST